MSMKWMKDGEHTETMRFFSIYYELLEKNCDQNVFTVSVVHFRTIHNHYSLCLVQKMI